ncbi:hypothetical protein L1887_25940 [Cichorium endivia]|nr:hypothetical protein L1887_25940 [Cichorium endivia]
MYHSPVTNALWQARSIFDTPSTTGVDSITAKTPSLSRTTIHYPFSSDYILREQYRNPWNGIRVGKLLEVSIRWQLLFDLPSVRASDHRIEPILGAHARDLLRLLLSRIRYIIKRFGSLLARDSKTGKSAIINQREDYNKKRD